MNFYFKHILAGFFIAGVMSALYAGAYEISISEIVADNDNGIRDEDGDREDWFELRNSGTNAVNLRGWWVTDKILIQDKWEIPEVEIPAGGYLLIWASGKDRDNPRMPLHTDFGLSKSGEYLGLYRPDPVSGLPLLVDDYAPEYPFIPPDISYGVTSVGAITNYIKSGDIGCYRVLTSAEGDTFYSGTDYAAGHIGHDQSAGWNVSAEFDDSSWTFAATGIGYDTNGGYLPWIGESPESNCQTALRTINTSLCFRKPFVVDDVKELLAFTLKMKYEDGFVAFVNGIEVGRANCSAAMVYNTRAAAALDESIVNSWTEYTVPISLIHNGVNILAVQGLNSTLTSSDFLLLPELEATLVGEDSRGYYGEPTPGEPNGLPTGGPLVFDAEPKDPDITRPLGNPTSPPIILRVKVIATQSAVASVRFYSRRMYAAEVALVLMRDDGSAPDLFAGDGVYSASLNTTAVAPGEMLRWRFEAEDLEGRITKLPAFYDPMNNPEYFGTVAVDSSINTSLLNTLYWFVNNAPVTGPTWSNFRGSCYYLTNFYDNTGHEIHGQSTAGFPKKSYDFDFTDDKRFLWRDGERRIKDLNLLSNYADKTKTRNTIAHWFGTLLDTPSHFCSPVRVHLNGSFHGVMDMMEDSDDRMLERNGLDPEGALYKIYKSDLVTSAEKKTRKYEDHQDLIDLANGLSTTRTIAERQIYMYDHLDVAALVNYLVVRQITADSDHGHKNFLMYRDTNDTREWQPIVWDVDLSYGHMWTSAEHYFDDHLYYMPPQISLNRGSSCPVYLALYNTPEVREMWARRMRTLMDQWMQPPGTVDGIFETKMREIAAVIDPDPADPSPWTDGDLDIAKWGIDYRWDVINRAREEVERLVTEYYPPRRAYLFNSGEGRPSLYGTLIPEAPQVNAAGMVCISEIKSVPESEMLCDEYLILQNMTAEAVDISGWIVEGSISHTFKGGTVIPVGAGGIADSYKGLLHLVKDAFAFRLRSSGPTGGERRFVQGNYQGELPSEAGTITLRDESGMMIFTTNYVGALSPSQKSLRVTELNYHPMPPTVDELAQYSYAMDEDFEYIELKNTGSVELNLTGAVFTDGIDYTFPQAYLGVGQRLVVAKNLTAFNLRYPIVTAQVYGPYDGLLNNASDRLVLIDAGGDKVLEFEYSDDWYELSDGSGRALVLRIESIATNQYNDLFSWNVSWNPLGSPGAGEAAEAQAYHGWDNLKFTELELLDPLLSGAYSDPDNDGRLNWVEYAFGSDPKKSDVRAPLKFEWYKSGDKKYAEFFYSRTKNVVDVDFDLVHTEDLLSDVWELTNLSLRFRMVFGSFESLRYRETTPATASQRFYTLRLNYSGDD